MEESLGGSCEGVICCETPDEVEAETVSGTEAETGMVPTVVSGP